MLVTGAALYCRELERFTGKHWPALEHSCVTACRGGRYSRTHFTSVETKALRAKTPTHLGRNQLRTCFHFLPAPEEVAV